MLIETRMRLVIRECEERRDLQRFSEVKQSIYNNAPIHATAYQSLPPNLNPNNHLSHYTPTTPAGGARYSAMPPNNGYASNGYGAANGQLPGTMQQGGTPHNRGLPKGISVLSRERLGFTFKPSPFYDIVARIGDVRVCDGWFGHLHLSRLGC